MDPTQFFEQQMRRAQFPQGRVGPRQQAAGRVFDEQAALQRGQFAGTGGQQGAVAAARAQRMAPTMAAKKSQMMSEASGMDQQRAEDMAMQAIQQQLEQERWAMEKEKMEQEMSPWGRLLDIGTTVAPQVAAML